jgi:hypothetical protein
MYMRLLSGLVCVLAAGGVSAQVTVRSNAAANAAGLTATVDGFRTDLGGPNNGVGAVATNVGRREINWDATPNGFSAPNALPGGFFNQNSQRGLFMEPVSPATGFMVSDTASSGNGAGVEFANLNATYPAQFLTFSVQKLFTPLGGNRFDIVFFVPLTGSAQPGRIPAVVKGFGLVMTDVDQAGTSALQFFDADDQSLGAFALPPSNGGLSFLGMFMTGGFPEIARVRVTLGNAAIGADDSPDSPNFRDIVVLDDFIYGEPQAILLGDGFE